jgi:4-hydroxybenzoate polyprenyltransferase
MTDINDVGVKNRFNNGIHLIFYLIKSLYILFDKFVSFLTVCSIFIGITAFLLPYFSFLLYEVKVNFNLLFASFLLTFAVYNINKLTDIKEDSVNVPDRAGFIEKNKYSVIFAVVAAYIASLVLSFLQNPFAIFIILFPFCMGIVYSIKLSRFRLKDITGIKNITIALSWAVIGTFLPLAVSFRDFTKISLVFYFFFIRVFMGSSTFDVRDIEGDKLSGVRTIPVVFGRQKTKNLLLILNSTLIPWLVFSYLAGYFHQYLFVLIFAIAYGYWYILHFCKEGLKIGKSLDLLVDGEWIPIVLLCLITQYLVGFA